jgi:beta-lactamase regulating signal transducer with metallopeptidase domain
MIPAFLTRVIVTSLLLACAALAAERVATWYGRSRRWIWVAAIGASLALPAMSRWTPDVLGRTRIIDRSAQIISAFQPLRDGLTQARQSPRATEGAAAARAPIDITRALELVWIGLSLTMFALVAVAYLRLRRVWTRSALAEIDGERVLAADSTGPAVIGILHPAIVVPRWVMEMPADERRLIILHEREHIDGRDPWLLAFATVATIAMPWNVVIWWQYVRLRLAIETDCDARVLARTGNCDLYGRMLIRTAGDTVALPMLVPAWGEAASQLKERILAMTARPPRARFALSALCAVLASALTLAACAATARPREARSSTPAAAAQRWRAGAGDSLYGLPGRGYARVTGYTRDSMRTRVVLSGTRATIEVDSGRATVRGDTLEGATPIVFHVVTTGAPVYRLVAHAIETGTEVEIFGVAPGGSGAPYAGGARGPAPMLNFARDHAEAMPMPNATPAAVPPQAAPPARPVEVPEPARPPANFDPGAIRIESESGDRVRVRISSNVSFRVRGAGVSSDGSNGTVEIVTPSNIVLTGTGGFAIVFEPVDPSAGIRVSADGRPEDGFVRAIAWSGARQADSTRTGGAIAVCSSRKGSSGIRSVARGTLAREVNCE